MPWDWVGFKEVAERLAVSSDEGDQRTAISRAYYFAHHRACEYCSEVLNETLPRDGRRHQVVIDLLDQGNVAESIVAGKLKRIRSERTKADYDRRYERPIERSVNLAMADSLSVAEDLQKLKA